MASIRRRKDMGGKYELAYIDVDGRRYRINTETRDKKIAEVWLKKVEDLISLAKVGVIEKVGRLTREVVAGQTTPGETTRLRLDAFEQEYLERGRQDLGMAEGTLKLNHCAFDSFQGMVGNVYIDTLTAEDVRRWKRGLTKQNRSKNTISIYQRALKTAFKRAVRWKLLSENPFADVEIPSTKGDQKVRKSMDFEEVRTLLHVINDPMFKRFVEFLLYTGCRRNEILYLKREDLDLEQRILYAQIPKTHRRLALPINKALARVINEMIEDGELPESGYVFRSQSNRRGEKRGDVPWHPSSVTSRFKDYVRLAGLPDHHSVHSCRHTYATHLRSKGIPQDVIQRLLGHTSTRTTNIYDHSDALFFREFADKIDFNEELPESES